jgi:Spy/CpxP family protein refolding chaperone
MRRINLMLLGILVCTVALFVHAAPTTKPSSPTAKPSMRLFSPYSKMATLSDDEKEKIHEIHRKYLDDLHDLERKQTDEIAALLTEDQKKELREIEDKISADAKARAGSKTPMANEGDH